MIHIWTAVFGKVADLFVMKSEKEQHRVWFDSVVQPKLQVLLDLSVGASDFHSFDHVGFFKEFLADLEIMQLDSYVTEVRTEKICEAIELLKSREFKEGKFTLKDLALVASLQNSLDRFLFFNKWQTYRQFIKTHGPVSDEAMVDAFRLSAILRGFVLDIQQRASLMMETPHSGSDSEAC